MNRKEAGKGERAREEKGNKTYKYKAKTMLRVTTDGKSGRGGEEIYF